MTLNEVKTMYLNRSTTGDFSINALTKLINNYLIYNDYKSLKGVGAYGKALLLKQNWDKEISSETIYPDGSKQLKLNL